MAIVYDKNPDQIVRIWAQFFNEKNVSVFATYQIFLPVTKHLPTSFDDVLTIIGNKDLYDSNKMFNLSLLWMTMYDIFRRTFDYWLLEEADKWKRDKNIKYIDVYKNENQRVL